MKIGSIILGKIILNNRKVRSKVDMLSNCLVWFISSMVDAENGDPQHDAEVAQALIERADYCEIVTDDSEPRVRLGLTASDVFTSMEQKDGEIHVTCAKGLIETTADVPTLSEEGTALAAILFAVEKILREQQSDSVGDESCDC